MTCNRVAQGPSEFGIPMKERDYETQNPSFLGLKTI